MCPDREPETAVEAAYAAIEADARAGPGGLDHLGTSTRSGGARPGGGRGRRRAACGRARSRSRTTSTSRAGPRRPRARRSPYVPDETAPAVRDCVDAGAIVVGKTNMDQFATGLVGTRSPYGAPRCVASPAASSPVARAPDRRSPSPPASCRSRSAPTPAGSGRVPAALNGIVGLKPTRGLVSTQGRRPRLPLARLRLGVRPDDRRRGPDPLGARMAGSRRPLRPGAADPHPPGLGACASASRRSILATSSVTRTRPSVSRPPWRGSQPSAPRGGRRRAVPRRRGPALRRRAGRRAPGRVRGLRAGAPVGSDPTVREIIDRARLLGADAYAADLQRLARTPAPHGADVGDGGRPRAADHRHDVHGRPDPRRAHRPKREPRSLHQLRQPPGPLRGVRSGRRAPGRPARGSLAHRTGLRRAHRPRRRCGPAP